MKIETAAECDNCQIRTENYMAYEGWIHIEGSGLVCLSRRTDGKETAENETCFDFCSEKCLTDYVQTMIEVEAIAEEK